MQQNKSGLVLQQPARPSDAVRGLEAQFTTNELCDALAALIDLGYVRVGRRPGTLDRGIRRKGVQIFGLTELRP